jgi:hypothetical protein
MHRLNAAPNRHAFDIPLRFRFVSKGCVAMAKVRVVPTFWAQVGPWRTQESLNDFQPFCLEHGIKIEICVPVTGRQHAVTRLHLGLL